MCKVIVFTDTKKLNLKQHLNGIANTLLRTEKDGFGYAIQGKSGVFGEKTIAKTFRTRLGYGDHAITLPVIKKKYELFGSPDELTGPGLFHGRTSTNAEGLINTHPMSRDGWHLIHNGVVQDLGPKYEKTTDNDSEDLLYRLIEGYDANDLSKVPEGAMQHVERYLEGYYAFAAIDPLGRLHVARDEYATLFIAYSPIYETHLIATTEELLMKVNKMLEAGMGPIDEVDSDVYMIFEGNQLIHWEYIRPLGFTVKQAEKSVASLGRVLSPGMTNRSYETKTDEEWNHILDTHHRRAVKYDEMVSEEDWQLAEDGIIDMTDRGSNDIDQDWLNYRNELDSVDASYTVWDDAGRFVDTYDFKQMDAISQQLCTVVRGDGTVVNPDNYSERKLFSGAI